VPGRHRSSSLFKQKVSKKLLPNIYNKLVNLKVSLEGLLNIQT